jgi:type IX secretion system PorP/SprF family membrane protein
MVEKLKGHLGLFDNFMMIVFRTLVLLGILIGPITVCNGQQFPIYTQYMFNPYMVNPSMLAVNRQSEINLLYRQQWTGIQDGPKTLQFDFQHPFSNRVAVGLNVFDDRSILLSRTSAMATFGYRVPLATDHILSFGLSGGFFSNRIRVEDIPNIDANDPVILNSSANNFSFNGQFGLSYSFRNFNVGFSLIQLVDHKTFSEDPIQDFAFSELKSKIIFASYQFDLSGNFSLQPNFSYRFTSDDLNFYEASALFSYRNLIAVGGGYRESYGATAIAQVTVKALQIGFAYDFPSTKASVLAGGTNEFQLKWKFGKVLDKLTKREKIPKVEADSDASQVAVVAEEPAPVVEKPKEEPVVVEIPKEQEKPIAETKPPVEVVTPLAQEPKTQDEAQPKRFLLIAGSFSNNSNAQKLLRSLSAEGYVAEIIRIPGSRYYYVHIPKYNTDTVTLEKVLEIRELTLLKDAWFVEVKN